MKCCWCLELCSAPDVGHCLEVVHVEEHCGQPQVYNWSWLWTQCHLFIMSHRIYPWKSGCLSMHSWSAENRLVHWGKQPHKMHLSLLTKHQNFSPAFVEYVFSTDKAQSTLDARMPLCRQFFWCCLRALPLPLATAGSICLRLHLESSVDWA